jgi:hypothetical protein
MSWTLRPRDGWFCNAMDKDEDGMKSVNDLDKIDIRTNDFYEMINV